MAERRDPLSPRQKQALDIIKKLEKKGYGPSIQEIAEELGCGWGSTGNIIATLQRKLYVTRIKKVQRSLRSVA